MRWIENDWHIFSGLDELYRHAKFGEDRTTRAGCRCENVVFFRLDALALSVIATAITWLAGWLAVCHSRYCIKTTKRI